MRVLICGGREFGFTVTPTKKYPIYRIKPEQIRTLFQQLDQSHLCEPITAVGEGCAAGADFLGGIWAASRGIALEEFPANWDKYGGSAGPKRNQHQLDIFKPDLLIAFAGGTGTADMISRAYAAKVRVTEIR